VKKPLTPAEFIHQIKPEGASQDWVNNAIVLADFWACSIKKFVKLNIEELQNGRQHSSEHSAEESKGS
jgi:hypothetical protein